MRFVIIEQLIFHRAGPTRDMKPGCLGSTTIYEETFVGSPPSYTEQTHLRSCPGWHFSYPSGALTFLHVVLGNSTGIAFAKLMHDTVLSTLKNRLVVCSAT